MAMAHGNLCYDSMLQRLEDAERAFDQLLRIDGDCFEAKLARQRVMAKQLVKLGFSVEQSEAAALHYNSVKTAAESLTATRCEYMLRFFHPSAADTVRE